MCQDEILVPTNPWHVVTFPSNIFLAQSSLRKLKSPSLYIVYVISTILLTLAGYSLVKYNWKK